MRTLKLVPMLIFWLLISPGVVTAEMFQSKEDSDVMSKMVEDLDEVWSDFQSLLLLLGCIMFRMYVLFKYKCYSSLDYKLQSSGLQYKRFLAFPWILTVTWPMDIVSMNLTLGNMAPLFLKTNFYLHYIISKTIIRNLSDLSCVIFFLPPSQDNGEYPLVMSGLYWKKFRSQFCEFVSVLISQCQYSVIFDNYLLSTLISLLTELSASHMRAFRHTCTLAGNSLNTDSHCLSLFESLSTDLHGESRGGVGCSGVKLLLSDFVSPSLCGPVAVKLLSALVNVALNLSVGVENNQKLCEVELAKMSSKRASPRLDKIQKKITEVRPWPTACSVVCVSFPLLSSLVNSFFFFWVGG